MNKRENHFLGLLISVSDENGYFKYDKLDSISKYSNAEKSDMLRSLISYGYIKQESLDRLRVTANGKYAYTSPKKKFALLFFKNSYNLLKFVFTYILGIISGLAIAYFTHLFGWN